MRTRAEVLRDQQALKLELNKIETEEKRRASLTEEQKIATLLHDKLCRWNHTDGCAWHYDEYNWSEFSHQKYLQNAASLTSKGFGSLAVQDFLDCI